MEEPSTERPSGAIVYAGYHERRELGMRLIALRGAPGPALPVVDAPSPLAVPRLSEREREVLRWTLLGLSSAVIARQLRLSRKTVDTYRMRLMLKLGAADRSDLIRLMNKYDLTFHDFLQDSFASAHVARVNGRRGAARRA